MSWKMGFQCIGILGIATCFACVSGAIRNVNVSNELPKDISKEMKEKFEIQVDSGEPLKGPKLASVPPVKKSKKGKKKDLVKTEGPFVYPERRPQKDAVWIGERLEYSISYFGVAAGDLIIEILPFKIMNHRKVYHIRATAISSAVFSLFYRLHDIVETFFDYEGQFSHRFHLVLDETKQNRDALELYDSEKKETYYWNRWNHKEIGKRETKETGPIEPFSQDSLSALFYARSKSYPDGSSITFPVVSEGKKWEAVVSVVRRETVDSPFGKVPAIVLRPETKFEGVLKKTGDSYLWLTDDDRKIPLKLEAKVKVGTVVASLKKAELGTPPGTSPPLAEQTPEANRLPSSVSASPTGVPSPSPSMSP